MPGFPNKQDNGENLTAAELLWVQTGSSGVVLLEETTAPSATAGFGKLYSKSSDSKLYYKNDSGTEFDLTNTEGALTFSTGLTRAVNTITSNISTGIAGGQTIYGGTAANESLTIHGTINATKTTSYVLLQPAGGNVGIGTASPGAKLDVHGDTAVSTTDYYGSSAWTGRLSAVSVNTQAGLLLRAYSSGGLPALASIHAVPVADYRSGLVATYSGDGSGSGYFAVNQFLPTSSATLERMRIDVSGNVGIGTASPINLLTVGVTGDSANTSPTLRIQGQSISDGANPYGSYGSFILNSTNGYTASARRFLVTNALNLNTFAIIRSTNGTTDPTLGTAGVITSGTADFVISNAGNVGIGTTAPVAKTQIQTATVATFGDGANALRLEYAGGAVAGDVGAGVTFAQKWLTADSTLVRVGGIYGVKQAGDGGFGGGLAFYTQPASAADMSERVRIDQAGNVGIGTTAPGAKLSVVDSTAAQATFSGYAPLVGASGPAGAINIGDISAYQGVLQYTPAGNTTLSLDNTFNDAGAVTQFRMRTAGTPVTAMTILGSGNVGIGTTTPLGKLNIASSGDTGFYITDNSQALNAKTWEIRNTSTQLRFLGSNDDGSGSVIPLALTRTGNVGIGTTSPASRLQVAGDVAALPTTNVYQQLEITGSAIHTYRLSLGTLTTAVSGLAAGSGVIQPLTNATGWNNLYLNPNGGNVGIGIGAGMGGADYKLDVRGSANDSTSASIQVRNLAGLGNTSAGAIVNLKVSDASGFFGAFPSDYVDPIVADRVVFSANSDASGLVLNAQSAGQDIRFFAGASTERMRISNAGNVGIGTSSPDRLLHEEVSDAGTNAVVFGQRHTHITSGIAAVGFGIGEEYELENASGTNRVVGTSEFAFTDATNLTEDASWTLKLMRAGTLTTAISVDSSGVLSATNISGTNTGDQTITLTGDVTGTGTGSFAATLATVNANVGSFGSATAAGTFTVNAKGLITAASSATITPAVGSITGLGTGVATALGVNVGSAGAFVTFNGALGTPSSGTLTNTTGLPVSTGISGLGTGVATALGQNADSATGFVTATGVATTTNKRPQPRTASSTSAATLTPDLATANVYFRTTQTEALTIGAPTGTPVIGETIAIYVDSAGAQTLTINSTYKVFGAAFPASTTAGKTFMLTAQFNGTDWKTLWATAV